MHQGRHKATSVCGRAVNQYLPDTFTFITGLEVELLLLFQSQDTTGINIHNFCVCFAHGFASELWLDWTEWNVNHREAGGAEYLEILPPDRNIHVFIFQIVSRHLRISCFPSPAFHLLLSYIA